MKTAWELLQAEHKTWRLTLEATALLVAKAESEGTESENAKVETVVVRVGAVKEGEQEFTAIVNGTKKRQSRSDSSRYSS